MRLALTFLILLGVTAGCGTSTDDGVAAESALNNAGGIAISEQPPFNVRLGQAVAAEKAQFGWSDGTLLDARCVEGDVRSTLDMMKSIGSTALGYTSTAQAGMAPDGTVQLSFPSSVSPLSLPVSGD